MASAHLFSPLSLREVTLRNRAVVSPMLTYRARQGYAQDWHLSHLGKFAVGGCGLVFMEHTKVAPGGMATQFDCGLWKDEFVPGLRRISEFIKDAGATSGIQIGHTGRKARNSVPWEGRAQLEGPIPDVEGVAPWEIVGPSPIAADPSHEAPRELRGNEVEALVEAWGQAARRADEAGFDVLEVHGAHGYLIHQFLSEHSNHRTDKYGGSFENRMRLALEVTEEVRYRWPANKPLFFRLSAVDETGWTIEDTIALASELKKLGVDVIDCSSGGMGSAGSKRDTPRYGYQVRHAEAVRRAVGIQTMAVGMIVHPDHAEQIIAEGRADLVAVGREMLHNPNWALDAGEKLGVEDVYDALPDSYAYWLRKRRQDAARRGFEFRPSTSPSVQHLNEPLSVDH